MTIYEIIGVVFGFICVWLTVKQSIWSWPIGIINVLAFIVMFYGAKLYADVGLHVIYLALSVYGWFKWGQIKNDLPITNIKGGELTSWLTLLPFTTIALGWAFSTYTDAKSPYLDSFITITSLIAQYLMARKILQSWFFWIAVDCVAIGLYEYRGLHLTSILYFVYLILCIKGYNEWKYEKRV